MDNILSKSCRRRRRCTSLKGKGSRAGMGDVPPSMTDYDDDGDDDRRLFSLSRIIELSLIKTAAVAGVVESFTFLLSQITLTQIPI